MFSKKEIINNVFQNHTCYHNFMMMWKIKYLFLVLTVVFISTSTNALSCIDADKSTEMSTYLGLANIENVINNLKVNNIYDECFVEIRFDYYNQSIKISFGTASESNNVITNQQVIVHFSMNLSDGKIIFTPAKIVNNVRFACDYANECDRLFVLNHMKWLFNAKYDKLESTIRPLLTADNDNTGKNDVELS